MLVAKWRERLGRDLAAKLGLIDADHRRACLGQHGADRRADSRAARAGDDIGAAGEVDRFGHGQIDIRLPPSTISVVPVTMPGAVAKVAMKGAISVRRSGAWPSALGVRVSAGARRACG